MIDHHRECQILFNKFQSMVPVSKQRLFIRDLLLHQTFSISGDKLNATSRGGLAED